MSGYSFQIYLNLKVLNVVGFFPYNLYPKEKYVVVLGNGKYVRDQGRVTPRNDNE